MHFSAGGEFLMRHQIIVGLSGSSTNSGIILWYRGDLRGGFAADLQRQPCDQRQGHHRCNGRKSKIADTLGSTIVGGENSGFYLQTFMKGLSEALAEMIGLPQGIADQVISGPILMRIRMAFEFVEEDVRLILVHLAVHQCRNFLFHIHHLVPSLVPNNGRRLAAIASRALKILDLTVPIGQSITAAISS